MGEWWSWAGSNRRPQAICVQFYMCSRLIWVSLGVPRSDTLHTLPATLSLTSAQVARALASRCRLPCSRDANGIATAAALAQPIGQLLQGSPG